MEKVQSKKNERSYVIEGDTGGVYRRNRVHIRPTCVRNVPEPQNQASEGVGRSVDTKPAASSPVSADPPCALDTLTRSGEHVGNQSG